MKLRSLAINQFKKFTDPTRLDGVGDRLNVVVGPNEMGKSTLLDALKAVLFEKYNSKAKSIVALQNDRNRAGPVVELAFELDDGPDRIPKLYRIAKRFIKKPYASLSCPDGRKLEGDAAEDKLRCLLGFVGPSRAGAKPETLGMWNVLWVGQGKSFGGVEFPESARANLHSALESEVGDVLGGARGRDLPQAVKKRLDELVTATGKPRGSYKELSEQVEKLKDELKNLQERRKELSQALENLEDAQKALMRLDSGDDDHEDRVELGKVRQQHRQCSELEARIEAASKDLELKGRKLKDAEQAVAARRIQTEEIKAAEGIFEKAEKRLVEAQQHEQAVRSRFDGLRADLREAEEVFQDASQALSRNQRVLTMVELRARICELEDQHEKAVAAEKRENMVLLKADAIRATDETVEAVRHAKRGLDTANSRIDAAATLISFYMADESLSGIEIDGRPLTADQRSVPVVEPITITIPERGQIAIKPTIKNSETLLRQRRETKAVFERALDEAGAATIEDAENQLSERKDLLRDAELARQEVALWAPATEEREGGARALATHLEGLRRDLAHGMKESGLRYLPARPEAETELRSAEEQRTDEARRAYMAARAAVDGPEKELHRSQGELGKKKAQSEAADAHLGGLRRRLQAAEEKHSNEELQIAIKAARAAQESQGAAVAGLDAQRTGRTLEQLQARIDRLEGAIKARNDKRTNLRVKIAGLESDVKAADGAGLDEAIKKKEQELELCAGECKHLSRETQVLDLLLSALQSAEREAKKRYLSPVRSRVLPYLRHLFSGADIQVDENFRIDRVVRGDGYEEPFPQLSMGTQEQIAVLVRLAFAEMLVEQGRPASVVLDDALVFSDDRRMRRMFDILSKVSRNIQIVIFTCREQLFEGLGGKQLTLVPDEEELLSA